MIAAKELSSNPLSDSFVRSRPVDAASEPASRPRILLVDDDEPVLKSFRRLLEIKGFEVVTALDAESAMIALREQTFDAMSTDLSMPGTDGLTLLEHVRRELEDLPVIIMAGDPSLASAMRAMELGARRCLVKPIDGLTFVGALDEAVKSGREARAKREALALVGGVEKVASGRGEAYRVFQSALQTFHMAYQPIVDARERRIVGFEALLRSREPALPTPPALLAAAERLQATHVLGRAIRRRIAEDLARAPEDALVFVNLHPHDLLDEDLYSRTEGFAPHARRIVLELTERASIEAIPDVMERVARLRGLGYAVALDDLGAGYAGLTCFATLEPDVVKLDMGLIRDVHLKKTKQKLVGIVVQLCHDLGVRVVAEGVETTEELDFLLGAGCDWIQGYLLARPGPPFPALV